MKASPVPQHSAACIHALPGLSALQECRTADVQPRTCDASLTYVCLWQRAAQHGMLALSYTLLL